MKHRHNCLSLDNVLGRHACDCQTPGQMLMRAQMEAEFELAHTTDLDRYRRALQGIASCATQCGCCKMHKEIAEGALAGGG